MQILHNLQNAASACLAWNDEKQFPLRQLENLASHFPGRDNGEALEVFLRIASIH